MDIDALLQKEITGEFENLGELELGSDEYKATVDGITKLVDRAIEIKKFDAERDDLRHEKLVEAEERKVEQSRFEDEKKDRMIKNGLSAAGIIIPTIVTIWGTFKSFQFEKTGSVTTIMGRGFINKLIPKK